MKKIFLSQLALFTLLFIFVLYIFFVQDKERPFGRYIGQYQSFQGVTASYDAMTGYIIVHDTNINRLVSFQGTYPSRVGKHPEEVRFVNEDAFKKSIYGEAKISITNTIKKMTTVTMTTNQGEITLELFGDLKPKTVENFTKLAKDGFYNGTRFHRVIKGFMVQGGDPNTQDRAENYYMPGTDKYVARDHMDIWGTGGPGYSFADELSNENNNVIGTISMANSGPNTNGSQFFINTANNNFLDTKHTVFGKVVAGMDVVSKIENNKTGQNDRPIEDMIIEKMEVK
ncbi:MAG: Peptidyl-prolyl cis-trans isomerase [Parcubacteria group bacterium GW2011_GWA1_44_13]|uniref:Peptidyl-prolyl cis-trans isomerase n=1 Tax=Candidatus Nomurabacteria bacterium GW2011_GWB1_44_12 TaxID=1618748 RepID=A0A837I6S6_9BACT|nr:MAG: Peptidyl-prolyl cis-trans isomerase [Candidatus Nomurabacteria bacterium GW2011_GWB1_44_12]KKT38174.1 MAG: Peptidyl-prolyl cis-trans isomerase [Parcubacteria group bacterium GW2011_GWA1_44_13]